MSSRYQLTPKIAETIINHTWNGVGTRIIANGANNSFGIWQGSNLIEDKKGIVVDKLSHANAIVVPDWVANCGTAQLFHRGLSVDFGDSTKPDYSSRVLQACVDPVSQFLRAAQNKSRGSPLHVAAELLAAHYMKNPRPIVSEIASGSRYSNPPVDPSKLAPLSQRLESCLSVANGGGECVQPEELKALLERNPAPVAYDGFEPSGRMHIAQGVLKTINVGKLTKAGFTYIFWVADWFAFLNHKMGGDLKKIQMVGQYFIEIWKALGMDMSRVKFLWASEEITRHADEYWGMVLDIAAKNSITRISRCTTIMGRAEDKFMELDTSQVLYPVMQCADIFLLQVDVCQLGLDQRKVNMLAREYADQVKKPVPIILSHGMLPGLKESAEKMSKSDPDSAIFMEDTEADVASKIKKAFCPEGQVEHNPCLAYVEHIIFPSFSTGLTVDRPEKFGGSVTYNTYDQLLSDFKDKKLHPSDLKSMLIKYLNLLLEPVRRHFREDPFARELLEQIKTFQVTK